MKKRKGRKITTNEPKRKSRKLPRTGFKSANNNMGNHGERGDALEMCTADTDVCVCSVGYRPLHTTCGEIVGRIDNEGSYYTNYLHTYDFSRGRLGSIHFCASISKALLMYPWNVQAASEAWRRAAGGGGGGARCERGRQNRVMPAYSCLPSTHARAETAVTITVPGTPGMVPGHQVYFQHA